jgi:membrane associated rhomboid family serine protease
MFSLYLFGEFVEQKFVEIFDKLGKPLYLGMYILALFFSLLPTYFKNRHNYHYRSLGASGAVSAVIFAGLLVAPYIEVGLFFTPPFIPGFVFAPLFLIISYILDKKGKDNINHSAHIFGALFGLAFVFIVGKLVANYDAYAEFIWGVKAYFRSVG